MSERDDLFLKARAGDREALGDLLAGEANACYRLALRLCGSGEGAQEACQEACVEAVRNFALCRGADTFGPWLARLVVCAAAAQARRRQARVRAERRHVMETEQRQETPAPPLDLRAELDRALAALDERFRLPVVLHYMQGLSHAEVAAVLEEPSGTVATNISRGVDQLREALSRAGHACTAAALIPLLAGALEATAPAALVAKMKLIAVGGAGAVSPAAAAAKGGIAMKVIAGVVAAGALAGGAVLFASPSTLHPPPSTNLSAPPPAPAKTEPMQGPPRSVHYAVAAQWDYLDGPRLGSMIMAHRGSMCDDQDNLYLLTYYGLPALRCVRANGMVETISGDDRPLNDLGLSEGPASYLPRLSAYGGFGSIASWMSVQGAPFDGEDKGSIYVGATGGAAFRIFRNKAQGGRWWFKRFAFAELKRPFQVRVESDDRSLGVVCDGSYYRYDAGKGTLTPLLSPADYTTRVDKATGKKVVPDAIVRTEDGTFYLWNNSGEASSGKGIFRVLPDKSKCEEIVAQHAHGQEGNKMDGPGMTSTYFGGPILCGYRPPHTLFVTAVDDGLLRRWREGRVSTWSEKDGEWHEFAKLPPNQWFYGWCLGPRGANYAYNTYNGQCRDGDDRIFKVGPIDFDKATVGPLVEGK